MKILKKSFVSRARLYQGALFATIILVGFVVPSEAQLYTLSDNDSSVQVNLNSGVSDWQIDGVNQLNQQWFYYRVGSSGPESAIQSIAAPSLISDGSANSPSTLSATYANGTISVATGYSFQAAGNGSAQLTETITVKNVSGSSQAFHFFEYANFDLGGVSGNQNVQFNTLQHNLVTQSGNGITFNETAIAAGVTYEVQAGLNDGNLFGLTDGNPTALDNTLSAGPGDVNYAFEWDKTLNNNGSFIISKIMTVTVPEPSSLALIASGMVAAALMFRRRGSKKLDLQPELR